MLTMSDLRRRFKIVPTSIFGIWRNLSNTKAGEPVEGDCQDYAWTALNILTGGKPWRHILTGRACIWRVWSPVNGIVPRHAALWVRRWGWTDSTSRSWSVKRQHRLAWPAGLPVIAAVAFAIWGAF